jgi:thymidylate synthase
MNKLDQQYTDLLKTILEYGVDKKDRTGTGTKSIFGYTIRHNMKDGFPLLTTKKMPFKTIVTELLWFLRGDTNIKYLVDNNCHIWDGDAYKNYCNNINLPPTTTLPLGTKIVPTLYTQEEFINKIKTDDEFAKRWGDLGPIYGKQWRKWKQKDILEWGYKEGEIEIDQIQNLINDLKTNPDSRRLMVNAWNVGELDQMVLPPCHYGFQVYTRELSYEERCDVFQFTTDFNKENREHLKEFNNDIMNDYNTPTRAISLMWNQRSVDTFLGLPFNIASYGLLLEMLAKEVNMVPDQLIGNLGDVHLYSNHIEQAKEQIGRELSHDERISIYSELGLTESQESRTKGFINKEKFEPYIPKRTREPFPLPIVKLSSGHNLRAAIKGNFDEIDPNDIMLINYQSHPTIKAPLSN